MISAVQEIIARDPRGSDYPEVMVATDRAAVQARRSLQKQLASEKSTTEHHSSSPAAAETG
jgi:vanillate O-demethylase monooxygenase subunit